MPPKVMNLKLQRHILNKIAKKLNPDLEIDDIDWDHLDPLCNLQENLGNMAEANPEFVWKELELNEFNFNKKGWHIREMDDGVEYSTRSKIKFCKQGKYTYAKIQVITPEELVGLIADITIYKPHPKPKPEIKDTGLFDKFFGNTS
jgi:hypothetical protein